MDKDLDSDCMLQTSEFGLDVLHVCVWFVSYSLICISDIYAELNAYCDGILRCGDDQG